DRRHGRGHEAAVGDRARARQRDAGRLGERADRRARPDRDAGRREARQPAARAGPESPLAGRRARERADQGPNRDPVALIPTSTPGRSRNRSISASVAAFALLSFVASVAPLLPQGRSGASLLPGLERGTSFAAYAVFLLLFVFFFLPAAFRRDPGRGLVPWAP